MRQVQSLRQMTQGSMKGQGETVALSAFDTLSTERDAGNRIGILQVEADEIERGPDVSLYVPKCLLESLRPLKSLAGAVPSSAWA